MLGNKYTLTHIRHHDWDKIREWRNAQIDILRQELPITETQQLAYLNAYYSDLSVQYPHFKRYLFSFLLGIPGAERLIGYGGLVNIDWKNMSAETSFLLDPSRVKDKNKYRDELIIFHKLLEDATSYMHLHRWHGETFEFRAWHIHCLEEFGFNCEGIMRDAIRKEGRYLDVVITGKILYE